MNPANNLRLNSKQGRHGGPHDSAPGGKNQARNYRQWLAKQQQQQSHSNHLQDNNNEDDDEDDEEDDDEDEEDDDEDDGDNDMGENNAREGDAHGIGNIPLYTIFAIIMLSHV
jgi:hypothetical protein